MSYSIFLDFDGTLLPKGAKRISERNLKILTDLQKAGHKIFLNTGRPASFLDIDACRGFRFDGYLCGCAFINLRGKQIMADTMTADESQPILAHFYGRDIAVLIEGELAMYIAYPKEGYPEDNGIIPLKDMGEIFKVCELEPITKMNILADLSPEDLDFVSQFADPIPRPESHCTEVVIKGHDKALLIKTVAEYSELDRDKIIAMGDTTNDIPMLEYAPISVAMGNASEEVKSHAKYVTKTDKEDGVAVFLEEFFQ